MNIFIQITSPHTILQLCLSAKAARRAFEQIHQDVEQLAVLVVQVPRDGRHLIAQARLHHLGERHTEITQEANGVGVSLQHQEITVCQGDCCSPAIILVGRREEVRSRNGADLFRPALAAQSSPGRSILPTLVLAQLGLSWAKQFPQKPGSRALGPIPLGSSHCFPQELTDCAARLSSAAGDQLQHCQNPTG